MNSESAILSVILVTQKQHHKYSPKVNCWVQQAFKWAKTPNVRFVQLLETEVNLYLFIVVSAGDHGRLKASVKVLPTVQYRPS